MTSPAGKVRGWRNLSRRSRAINYQTYEPPDLEQALRNLIARARMRFRRFSQGGLGLVALVVAGIWMATGTTIVQPDEEGVLLRFGKVTRTITPGINWNWPWPVGRVLKPAVTRVQKIEVGFRTVSMGPPARYQTVPQEALMLTGDENIVSLEFIVQYRIKEPIHYLFHVRNPVGTLQDASEAAMREVIGRTVIDLALTEGKGVIQQEAEKLLQSILDDYRAGIHVVTVKLQDVNPPGGAVSDAFKDVISAQQDRERQINEAQGFQNDIIPAARGQAAQAINQAEAFQQSRITEAEGEANRYLALLQEYNRGKAVTKKRLYYEMIEEVLPKMEKLIVDAPVAKSVLPYLPLERQPARPRAKEVTP